MCGPGWPGGWRRSIRPKALVFDDTGFLKDGDASACVSRQYTGTAGKVTNCQVGVSLHLASDHASAAVELAAVPARDLGSRPRRRPIRTRSPAVTSCGIPDDVGHVEKWQLALDMIDETRSWGIEVPLVVADAGYGDAAAFRLGLDERGLDYVVGISTTHVGPTRRRACRCTEPYSGTGTTAGPASTPTRPSR